MQILRRMRSALRALARGDADDRELDEEMRFHLERETELRMRGGMDAASARSAALRSFGGVERFREAARDERGGQALAMLLRDLSYGARALRREPGFAAVGIVTLALGIGAATAIFSVLNGVLLAPLPYPHSEELVAVYGRFLPVSGFDFPRFPLSAPEYFDYAEGARAMESTAAWRAGSATLTGPEGEPAQVRGVAATASLSRVLRVTPAIGRFYRPEEDVPDGPDVVVVSDRLWRTRFGADTSLVGRAIRVDGRVREVIGVMPRGFAFPSRDADLWMPLRPDRAVQTNRASHGWSAIGRLATGATLASAEAERATMMARWERDYPEIHTGHFLVVESMLESEVGAARRALFVLLAAVGLLLLIACVNVANLLLARAPAREREMAVRAALGARRTRLVRQLLAESLVLAGAGGVIGVLLAVAGVRAIVAIGSESIPRVDDVRLSGPVLGFAILTTVFSSVLFGLVPALRGGSVDVQATLRRGGRAIAGSGVRLRRVLVAVEIALAMIVALGAGLLIRSFGELLRVDPGFDSEGVLVSSLNLPAARYADAGRTLTFQSALRARLTAAPGVSAFGVASSIPLADSPPNVDFDVEGAPERGAGAPMTSGDMIAATPGFDRAIGARIVRGRFFEATDGPADPPVAVVNRTAARLFWPGVDPIGRRIRVADDAPWLAIVGVIDDVLYQSLDAEPRQAWYIPYTQAEATFGAPVRTMKLVLRTAGDPLPLADIIRSSVREIDPELPVVGIRPMTNVVAGSVAGPRFTTVLLSLFAGVALLLGAVGIYGVIAYTVSQRGKELGIRMALGAGYRDTTGMVLAQGMKLMALGVLIGIAGALGLTRLLSGLLFGVRPNDPLTFIAVSLVLAAIGALACWIPARRARTVDLSSVLRTD